MKFEYAPRERILFVQRLADVFLDKVLGIEEALVSDESLLWDFGGFFYDIENAIRPGSRPGYYVFLKQKVLRGGPYSQEAMTQRMAEIPDVEIEEEPTYFRRDTIQRTKEVFGVDITEVFDRYLPEVLHYILVNMPPEKRAEYSFIFESRQ